MSPRTTDCALCPVAIPFGVPCWLIDSGGCGRLKDRVTICDECRTALREAS